MVVERSFEYENRAYFIFYDKGLPIVKRPFLLLSTMKESIAQPSFGSWCNWLPLIWRIPCFYIEQTTWQSSYWTILLGEPSGGPLQVTLFRPYANHLPICFVSIKTMVYMTILVGTNLLILYIACVTHTAQIYHCLDTKQQSVNELFSKVNTNSQNNIEFEKSPIC